MTEPNPPRAVPGPPPPGSADATTDDVTTDDVTTDDATTDDVTTAGPTDDRATFGDLHGRPVAEHVTVFEDEHARLRRELGTIDQL
jgi:hypothetical protein